MLARARQILLPVGRGKGSFIDSRDIAAVAAQLLSTADFDNQDFDLTGPRALDHDEGKLPQARANSNGQARGWREA